MGRLIGIDPGSIKTGFAVLDAATKKYIAGGTILLNAEQPLAERLFALSEDIEELLKKYEVTELAIESLFFAKNAQSALKLGHARGVILMKAAAARVFIYEYTPTEVKNSVAGTGRAKKDQIAQMCRLLLKLPKSFQFHSEDQSDALALALTHVQSRLKTRTNGGITKKNDRSTFWQTHS